MGDKTGQATVGFMWRDLGGAIWTVQSPRRDLDGVPGVGVVVRWLVCSSSSLSLLSLLALAFSLSLGVCEFGNHLKVKQKRK